VPSLSIAVLHRSGRTRSTSFVAVELAGKTILLTGATGGLGRAIASALADRGASLILSSRKPEELDRLAASLPGSDHRTIVSDLAEEGAALALLAEAGEIDALVANAGLPGSGKLEGFTASAKAWASAPTTCVSFRHWPARP
jgi:short-subunit dehydrogenase